MSRGDALPVISLTILALCLVGAFVLLLWTIVDVLIDVLVWARG
jgi:hypothetical protein